MPSTADSESAMAPSELVRMRFVDEETEVPAEIFDAMLNHGKAAKQRFAHDRVHGRLGVVLIRTDSLMVNQFCQSAAEPKPTCPAPPSHIPQIAQEELKPTCPPPPRHFAQQSLEDGPEAFLYTPLDVIQWEEDPFGVLFQFQEPQKKEETRRKVQVNTGEVTAHPPPQCKVP